MVATISLRDLLDQKEQRVVGRLHPFLRRDIEAG
jgi:hypothetical protein